MKHIRSVGMDVSGSSGFMHVASITHCFLEVQLGQTRNNEQKLAENMNIYRIDIWRHGTITINVTIRVRLGQYNTELKTSGMKDDYAIDI